MWNLAICGIGIDIELGCIELGYLWNWDGFGIGIYVELGCE